MIFSSWDHHESHLQKFSNSVFNRNQREPKMELTLFVPAKLTFSEYLRCLNFPLWTLWPAKTKQVSEGHLFWDMVPTRSGIFRHLKFSENVNFAGTNSVDSILDETRKCDEHRDRQLKTHKRGVWNIYFDMHSFLVCIFHLPL